MAKVRWFARIKEPDPYGIDEPRLHWFWRKLALPIALILTPLATWAFTRGIAALDTVPDGVSIRTVLIYLVLGFLGLCLGIGLNIVNQRVRTRDSEIEAAERRQNLVWINDQLAPVIDTLSDFLTSPRSYDDGVVFVKRVLSDARSLIPFDDARLCVYRLDRVEKPHQLRGPREPDPVGTGMAVDRPSECYMTDADGDATDFILDLFAFRGRGDHPRPTFLPSNGKGEVVPHGRRIIAVARGYQAWAVDDYVEHPTSVDRKEGSVWKSFLAVPIVHEKASLGVLMIDTRDQIHFTHQHISVGWTISKFLGIGLAALKDGGVDYDPELRDIVKLWNLSNAETADSDHEAWEISYEEAREEGEEGTDGNDR